MPSDQHLQHARTELEECARLADDELRDDLRETAASFAAIVSGDQEADYAVIDEHLNALRQAKGEADGEVTDGIDRALEYAEAYRTELEQG